MSLRHVQSGQPLQISAGDWNKIIDATRAHYAGQGAARSAPPSAGREVIYIRNDSGEDLDRFAVLGIDGPIITPDDNADEFKRVVAFSGVMPSETDHGIDRGGRFAILLEPLALGAIGRAALSGVCQVKVDIEDEAHAFADVADDDTSALKSTSGGSAVILWKQPGTGVQWAIVRFGAAAGERQLWVKITGSSHVTDNRWVYSGVEVEPERQGRWAQKPDGWSGELWNTIEANNSGAGVQGSGDNVSDFPDGVDLKPIGTGAVVPAKRLMNCDGEEEVHFTVANNAGGSCQ